jgi:hypothetical protein
MAECSDRQRQRRIAPVYGNKGCRPSLSESRIPAVLFWYLWTGRVVEARNLSLAVLQ